MVNPKVQCQLKKSSAKITNWVSYLKLYKQTLFHVLELIWYNLNVLKK